jgi:hypothetical protein
MATKPSRASKPLSENVAVPDGTLLSEVNEPLVPYIEQYKQFAKAGTNGVIDQYRTLVLAEEELSKKNFRRFCEELKLSPESSTFRKYKKIGEAADRLKCVADRLPSSWTTLYQLAMLKPEKFDRLLASGQLHPAMTAQELAVAISEGQTEARVHYFVRVDLDKVTDGIRIEALNKMTELAKAYGIEMKSSKPLNSLVEGWKQQGSESTLETAS